MSLFYERLPLRETPREGKLSPKVLRRAGIGESYWDVSLDLIPEGLAHKDVVEGYILKMHEYERRGWGLVLGGPHGTGKTALGCIILREALLRRARCYSIRCPLMVDRLWEKKVVTLPNGAPFFEGITNVNYLFIDDFVVFESKAKNSAVEQVIYTRYEKCLPTIIATNLRARKVFEMPYLKSLLKDRYWAVPVQGVNWRGKNDDDDDDGQP